MGPGQCAVLPLRCGAVPAGQALRSALPTAPSATGLLCRCRRGSCANLRAGRGSVAAETCWGRQGPGARVGLLLRSAGTAWPAAPRARLVALQACADALSRATPSQVASGGVGGCWCAGGAWVRGAGQPADPGGGQAAPRQAAPRRTRRPLMPRPRPPVSPRPCTPCPPRAPGRTSPTRSPAVAHLSSTPPPLPRSRRAAGLRSSGSSARRSFSSLYVELPRAGSCSSWTGRPAGFGELIMHRGAL